MPIAPPGCDNQRCLWTLTHVPRERAESPHLRSSSLRDNFTQTKEKPTVLRKLLRCPHAYGGLPARCCALILPFLIYAIFCLWWQMSNDYSEPSIWGIIYGGARLSLSLGDAPSHRPSTLSPSVRTLLLTWSGALTPGFWSSLQPGASPGPSETNLLCTELPLWRAYLFACAVAHDIY